MRDLKSISTFVKSISTFVKSMSVSKRLILYITSLLIVQMALIGFFSYNWTSKYLINVNMTKIRETNYTIMQQVNYIRNKYENISDMFLANPTIQELLLFNLNTTSQAMISQNKKTIEKSLSDSGEKTHSMIAGNNGIIYQSFSGKYNYITFEQVKNSEIYQQSKLSDGSNLWLPSHTNLVAGAPSPYLHLCRTYMSTSVLYKSLGQLIIQIPISELQQVFKESTLDTREYYAIINNDGKYIYHTTDLNMMGKYADKEILSFLSDGSDGDQIIDLGEGDFLLSYSIYKKNGWNVIHVLPMDVIQSRAREASNYILLIMLISMIISLPVLVLILKSFTNPIRTLKTAVERFGNGNFSIRAKANRMDEIGLLQNSFNKMADEIINQMKKMEEDNKQKRLMEINMLEYQINPHFLYNSLDFINWMAHKSGNEDISEMVVALARFFRVGLSKGREFYTVRDELDHAQQYLLINKLRFKYCFQFEILADPEVLNYSTIKIILQPAVENAIKHGINKNNTDGFIRVTAKKEKDSIIFEINDNGAGMDGDRLEAIQKILKNHTPLDLDSGGNGFGLYNVNMRLWMQYGDGFGVTVESSLGAGTTIRVKIPAITL